MEESALQKHDKDEVSGLVVMQMHGQSRQALRYAMLVYVTLQQTYIYI